MTANKVNNELKIITSSGRVILAEQWVDITNDLTNFDIFNVVNK